MNLKQRGRPKGIKNGEGTAPQWEPQVWKPIYETMVALAINNMNQLQIAETVKVHPVLVNRVLNCSKGKVRMTQLLMIKQKHTEHLLETKHAKMQDRAIEIMESVLNDNDLVERFPLQMFDRASRFVAGGKPNPANPFVEETPKEVPLQGTATYINQNILNIHAERLADGLDKLREIEEIHGKIK